MDYNYTKMEKDERANIIRSETWLKDDIENIGDILDECMELIPNDDSIINVQMVTSDSGLSRFWIYTIPKRWNN